MDFIDLWPHGINELIFQHLSGEELMKTTLVSRYWNEFISRSNSLKKIHLNLTDAPDWYINVIVHSKRRYCNLEANDASAISKDLIEIIANPHNKFISINLSEIEFYEERNIEQIILNIASSVEHLKLDDVSFKTTDYNEELLTSYNFPKLKKLQLSYTDTLPHANKYFEAFPNLEELTLINGSDENIKNLIIKSAVKLKRLELKGYFYDDQFFKDLSSQMPSRLHEFIFNEINSSSKEDVNLFYFNEFFWSQRNTLRSFKTDALIEPDELSNALKMPLFTELCIKGFHYDINKMRIHVDNLKANPPTKPASLTCLHVDVMDEILFEIIAICAPNLKELHVRRFEILDVSNPSYFLKLEELKILYMSYELKDRLSRKEDRTHFENLILISQEEE